MSSVKRVQLQRACWLRSGEELGPQMNTDEHRSKTKALSVFIGVHRRLRMSFSQPLTVAALSVVFVATMGAQTVDRTRNPHGPLPVSCEGCHTATAWKPIRAHPEFDHDTQTTYSLKGMHTDVACQGCHRSQIFKNAAHDCASCHADLHRAQMGNRCEQCHSVRGWTPALQMSARQHSNRFPLLGAHATAVCESCHQGAANGVYVGMSTECITCHRADFISANNPPHQQGNFPLDCSMCHSMNGWLGAKFDHTAIGHFALTGAHATIACTACHVGGNFAGAPAACLGCHQADLQNATNPNHIAGGFSTDCGQCHNTVTWTTATFNHNSSGFPLTGAHATVACTACHTGSNYAIAPRTCDGCHMTEYNQTSNPNHAQAGFPVDCSLCHSTIDWTAATFDHSKTTFPLTGAHATVLCATCHVNNNYTTISTNCDACHLTEYNTTNNPNHAQAGFPLNCALCHSTTNWTTATFDHSKTTFPLTGAHVSVPCASCHVANNYTTVPTDCYSCHKADYTGAQSPNHAASGFPTACAQCHTTATWAGATFNHTWFPIYSGTHANVWTSCADCHLDASNDNTFSCTNCHTHTESATDPHHNGVRGYSYTPTSCYSCHASGRR